MALNRIPKEFLDALMVRILIFHGTFVYQPNTKSKYVCRPTCKTRVSDLSSVEIFNNVRDATKFGLKACKRYWPHQEDYRCPELYLEAAKALLKNSAKRLSLERISRHVKVSTYYSCRQSMKHTGLSIRQYWVRYHPQYFERFR